MMLPIGWLRTLFGKRAFRLSPVLCWALLLGVLTHVVGFLMFSVQLGKISTAEESSPFVVFLNEAAMDPGSLANEWAELFDSAPLFIPTVWNAAAQDYRPLEMPVAGHFGDYLPTISLEQELWPSGTFGLREDTVENPRDLLDIRYLSPFRTFGQGPPASTEPLAWTSFVRVRVQEDGVERAGAEPTLWPLSGYPEMAELSRPASFTLYMSADGRLLSLPILLESSGQAELDQWAQDWLIAPERLAALPAGRLEISFFF